jgi:hypothetical protein
MNLKQLRKILAVEENHFRAEGDLETAVAVAIFANLLEGRYHMEVSEFADTTLRRRGSRRDRHLFGRIEGHDFDSRRLTADKPMQVAKLKRLLERLRDSYSAVGAEKPAKDMRRVTDLLKGFETKTVSEFVGETQALLANEKPATPRTRSTEELVARYVRELLDAGTDKAAFDAAMGLIDDDREIGKSELSEIANRYRNESSGGTYAIKFRSLKRARGAIRDVFLERCDAQSKRKAIDKLTRRA